MALKKDNFSIFFYLFLKNFLKNSLYYKPEILVLIERTGCGKLLYMSGFA